MGLEQHECEKSQFFNKYKLTHFNGMLFFHLSTIFFKHIYVVNTNNINQFSFWSEIEQLKTARGKINENYAVKDKCVSWHYVGNHISNNGAR